MLSPQEPEAGLRPVYHTEFHAHNKQRHYPTTITICYRTSASRNKPNRSGQIFDNFVIYRARGGFNSETFRLNRCHDDATRIDKDIRQRLMSLVKIFDTHLMNFKSDRYNMKI